MNLKLNKNDQIKKKFNYFQIKSDGNNQLK